MNITLIIVLAVILLLVIWLIAAYNGFVNLSNQAKSAWSDIDVQLKRRFDLIPNLVETVKGYVKHEAGTLEKLTQARAAAIGAQSVKEKESADNMLTGALKSLFAVAENYPDLKAATNFGQLQDQLSDVENQIQSARRFYNGSVRDFNIKVETFPDSIVASVFGFSQKEFFELGNEAEKEPVKVKF